MFFPAITFSEIQFEKFLMVYLRLPLTHGLKLALSKKFLHPFQGLQSIARIAGRQKVGNKSLDNEKPRSARTFNFIFGS